MSLQMTVQVPLGPHCSEPLQRLQEHRLDLHFTVLSIHYFASGHGWLSRTSARKGLEEEGPYCTARCNRIGSYDDTASAKQGCERCIGDMNERDHIALSREFVGLMQEEAAMRA